MNETIERVARAIVQADEQNGGAPWDLRVKLGRHVMETVYDEARAAIAALREPTEAMLSAGSRYLCFHSEGQINEDTGHVWHAMIDAALADDQR